ncbi:hypothetical protein DCS_07592 [Drechmeria coniospora]|uniref:Uncharacterized protein n=1 Tax=Drechmeria coniospora TaxID=98403 RepID=A0A151GEW0_DRECN|nr:hypothetical protein DCS_07592 [Drechmeria coniospora]KYK55629.1 hypothetical protein DCS_07592 [Drechmeria coniospora]
MHTFTVVDVFDVLNSTKCRREQAADTTCPIGFLAMAMTMADSALVQFPPGGSRSSVMPFSKDGVLDFCDITTEMLSGATKPGVGLSGSEYEYEYEYENENEHENEHENALDPTLTDYAFMNNSLHGDDFVRYGVILAAHTYLYCTYSLLIYIAVPHTYTVRIQYTDTCISSTAAASAPTPKDENKCVDNLYFISSLVSIVISVVTEYACQMVYRQLEILPNVSQRRRKKNETAIHPIHQAERRASMLTEHADPAC